MEIGIQCSIWSFCYLTFLGDSNSDVEIHTKTTFFAHRSTLWNKKKWRQQKLVQILIRCGRSWGTALAVTLDMGRLLWPAASWQYSRTDIAGANWRPGHRSGSCRVHVRHHRRLSRTVYHLWDHSILGRSICVGCYPARSNFKVDDAFTDCQQIISGLPYDWSLQTSDRRADCFRGSGKFLGCLRSFQQLPYRCRSDRPSRDRWKCARPGRPCWETYGWRNLL